MSTAVRNNIRRFSVYAFVVCYLIFYFAKLETFQYLAAAFAVAVFTCGFITMPKVNKIVCAILFVVGVAVLVIYNQPLSVYVGALLKNGALICLLAFAPILGMPFTYNPYHEEVKNICSRYFTNASSFLILTCIATWCLGFFTHLASVPIIYALLIESAQMYKVEKEFLLSIAIGVTTIIFCSPTAPAVATITESLSIPYSTLLVKSLPIVVCLMIASYVFFRFSLRNKKDAVALEKDLSIKVKWKDIGMIGVLAVLAIAIIISLNTITGWSLQVIIALIAAPFALIIALVQRKVPVFKKKLNGYYNGYLVKNPNVMAVMGIAGFAGSALAKAPWIDSFGSLFAGLEHVSFLFPFAIVAVGVILACCGCHAMVVMSLSLAAFTPLMLHTTTLTMAYIFLGSWVFSVMLSPFSAITLTISSISNKEIWDICIKENWKYAIYIIIVFGLIMNCYTFLGI